MTAKVLDADGMKALYGDFYSSGARQRLNRMRVPAHLHVLLPYAAFWGVADDRLREALVDSAPKGVTRNLKAVIDRHDDALQEWLSGPESEAEETSNEYVAFSALLMAADYI